MNMPKAIYEEKLKAYREDPRTACQYGMKCYQKNPVHHNRYKHLPEKQLKEAKEPEPVPTRKRKSSESDGEAPSGSHAQPSKFRKDNEDSSNQGTHSLSPDTDESDSENESDNSKPPFKKDSPPAKDSQAQKDKEITEEDSRDNMINQEKREGDTVEDESNGNSDSDLPPTEASKIISNLFLFKMPNDFYKFYEFCASIFAKDPCSALKLVNLKLVGPYDVLSGKISAEQPDDPEKYLRHWRYFYDPPEFQTVLKGNDKDGLHYGYWRDECDEKPVFVAKNCANIDCKIVPVAPNIFGAVESHIEERAKTASPFEKSPMIRLSKRLKAFAKENGITMEKGMQCTEIHGRNLEVVAQTFHGAGIVVPYHKKTQLGYRTLSATDSDLKKLLKKISDAKSDEAQRTAMTGIDEVVRLAVIAADEHDFGTCLEFGHDLFSSGIPSVHGVALQMLGSAYNLLNRQKFLKIAEAHLKDRKKGCDLSVV